VGLSLICLGGSSDIRQHPTDDEAIRELLINRRSPNAKTYPFPYNMTKEELTEVFRPKNTN
jgi:hypothetical protein